MRWIKLEEYWKKRESLKNTKQNIKVTVVYGDKKLIDCMKNVIIKRTKQ